MANRDSSPGAALCALADPSRRAILERLGRAPCTVGALADALPISRPAVSQHLKVLRGAGLVSVERVGTRAVHRLDPGGLGATRDWIDTLWDEALEAFEAAAEKEDER